MTDTAILPRNSVLSDLTQSQKTQLEMILRVVHVSPLASFCLLIFTHKVKDKDVLWQAGQEAAFVFIVISGHFRFVHCPEATMVEDITTGGYIGEGDALHNNAPLKTTVKAFSDGDIYKIFKEEFLNFLSKNPGLLVVFLRDKFII